MHKAHRTGAWGARVEFSRRDRRVAGHQAVRTRRVRRQWGGSRGCRRQRVLKSAKTVLPTRRPGNAVRRMPRLNALHHNNPSRPNKALKRHRKRKIHKNGKASLWFRLRPLRWTSERSPHSAPRQSSYKKTSPTCASRTRYAQIWSGRPGCWLSATWGSRRSTTRRLKWST